MNFERNGFDRGSLLLMENKTIFDSFAQNLFCLWLLSLPFYRFSVFKTLSVDNIIGPALIVLWVFTSPANDPEIRRTRIKEISLIFFLFSVFMFGQILMSIFTKELIWQKQHL